MKPRNNYVKVSIQPLQNNIKSELLDRYWEKELRKNAQYFQHMFPALASALASMNKKPVKVSELEKDDVQGISVIFGGKTTVAMKDDYTAISRCSPEDEYNPLLGAEIAIGRLVKKMRDDHE